MGQTLRLNAVAKNPGPVGTPAGCDAILSFVDRNGNAAGPNPLSVSLLPGQSAFLDMPSGLTRAGRTEARPVVTFPAAGGGADCEFAAEIFDQASGYTSVLKNPGPIQTPASQPGPTQTFSLIGLGFAQVAQVNVFAVQPGPPNTPSTAAADASGPCVVTIGFMDLAGASVGSMLGPVQVPPGQVISHYYLALPPIGGRVNIRPSVAVDSIAGTTCAGVQSLVETWDLFTDRTWSVAQPAFSDFAISITPPAQNVTAGTVVNFTVNTSVVVGSPGMLLLTPTLPQGVFAAFGSDPLPAGTSTTMAVAVGAMAHNGLQTIAVTAQSGSGTHTASVAINVTGGLP